MKKIKTLFLLLLLVAVNMNGIAQSSSIMPTGYPYADAMVLNTLLEKSPKDAADVAAIQRILGAYSNSILTKTKDTLSVSTSNAYLASVFSGVISELNGVIKNTANPPSAPANPEAAAGGMSGLPSPTMTIDAIGSFIAERFKQEINIAYLDKFREVLSGDSSMRILFPKTTTLLLTVEPYNYTSFLKSLSEDFNADFDAMPENITELLLKKVPVEKRTDGFYVFLIYADAMLQLQAGDFPIQVINEVSQSPWLDSFKNKDIASVIRLTGLISRSFTSGNTSRFWVPAAQVRQLTMPGNTRLRSLFLGLLMEKEAANLDKITFNGTTLKAILAGLNNAKLDFYNYLASVSQELDQMQQLLSNAKSKLSNVSVNDFIAYASSLFQLTGTVSNISSWSPITAGADFKKLKDEYLPLAQNILSLIDAVKSRQYGVALTVTLELCGKILSDDVALRTKLGKYGTFMVTMIDAKSSDEMVAALESAALPVGSYRIKRDSYFNLAINSYAGFLGGYEKLIGNDSITKANSKGWNYGFTAPVGLAFSWGFDRPKDMKTSDNRDGWSFSIFLPLIDVGAVTSFRLQDGTTQLPTLEWQNVWAPGIYGIIGIRNSPLAIHFGTQYGPNLRKIDAANNTAIIAPAWKVFNIGLTADIPLFNLKTKMEPPAKKTSASSTKKSTVKPS